MYPNNKAMTNKSTFQIAKECKQNSRCVIDNLKSKYRQEFRDRIKSLRNKEYDLCRRSLSNISLKDYLIFNVTDLHQQLSTSKEASYLDFKTIQKMLVEAEIEAIEEELQRQVENFEAEHDSEIQSIIDSLSVKCNACGRFIHNLVSNEICQECANLYFDIN